MSENPVLEIDQEEDAPVQDELEVLKARADKMGVRYHPNISLAKLKERLAKEDVEEGGEDVEKEVVAVGKETESQLRVRMRREANKLVRIRVSCMNPTKREWEGEIITTGNSLVGTIRKFVPFNAEEGYHVPHMIYEQLLQRECQIFHTVKDSKGNRSRKGKLIKEFAIEKLPPLTEQELKDLAQRQAMAAGGGV